jgi:hypothetical protein
MRKLFSICLLVYIAGICNAQEKTKPKYNELSQDELNLALTKSKKTIKTGKTLTFVGLGVAATGTIILMVEGFKAIEGDANGDTASAGAYVALAGGLVMYTGIPVWIVGGSKKKKIELELTKFKSPGSASINGVGIKVRF